MNERLMINVGINFNSMKAMKDLKMSLAKLQGSVKDIDVSGAVGFKNTADGADKATKSIKGATEASDTFFGKLAKQAKNMIIFSSIAMLVGFMTKNLRNAISVVTELDKAYTNFAIVTGASADQIERMDAEASKLTQTLGRLKSEVINSITEFSRAGYSLADSIELSRNAIIGANVGFTDLANVTKFTIAGLKAFGMEADEATRLIDTLFVVSNKTAIDFQGLGDAFLRSANTLQVAGASLEQSTALIAAANETIQDPAKVGTALKTISARLRGVGEDGQAIPTLARDLAAVGVEVQNLDGSFRNIYDIFADFAEVYSTLDDITAQNLVEKIAGKRQANIFIGLIENFDVAERALVEGLNSIGASALANERYLESVEGRTNLLREATNNLYQQILSDQALKLFITLLNQIVKVLTFATSGITGMVGGVALLGFSMMKLIGIIKATTIAAMGLTTVLTGGLAIFGILLGTMVATSAGMEKFGSTTEDSAMKIQELTSEIEKLDRQIGDLRAIENRTDAQESLLNILEKQLAIQKALREEEARVKLDNIRNEIDGATSSLRYFADSYDNMIKQIESLDDWQEGRFGYNRLIEEAEKLAKEASDSFVELTKLQSEMIEIMSVLDEGSSEYKAYASALNEVNSEIEILSERFQHISPQIGAVHGELNRTTEEIDELTRALMDVNNHLLDSTHRHELLSDAIYDMTTQGYLSQRMIQSLSETFPEFVNETKLAEGAVIDWSNEMIRGMEASAKASIDELAVQVEVMKARRNLLQSEMNRFHEFSSGLYSSEQYREQQKEIAEINRQIGNTENAIGLLNNELNRFNALEHNRNQRISEHNARLNQQTNAQARANKEDEIKLSQLSEEAKLVRDLNQEIAKKQKLISRTDDVSEQIRLNEELIKLNYQLKDAIIAQKKAHKANMAEMDKTTDEYDKAVDALYRMSLQIEDTTNAIYNLSRANDNLRQNMFSDVDELRRMIGNLVRQELRDEINAHREMIDLAREKLNLKLQEMEAERSLERFAKSRARHERELSRITSRMDSLRVAANQGDQRAINELLKLEEERAKTQEDLDVLVNDRAYELRRESLQKQFEEFEQQQNEMIKVLEDKLNDASAIIELSNQKMTEALNGNMDNLYNELVEWNRVYGTGFEHDVLNRWEKAIALIHEYNNALSSTGGFDFTDYAQGNVGATVPSRYEDILKEMRRNSDAWWQTQDEQEKRRLNQRNIELARSIGYSFNPHDGHYYSDTTGKRLIYDNGGFKPRGVEGYMAENTEEWVFKDKQIQAIQEMAVDSMFSRLSSFDPQFSSSADVTININGDVTDKNIARIEGKVENSIMSTFKSRGVKPRVKTR